MAILMKSNARIKFEKKPAKLFLVILGLFFIKACIIDGGITCIPLKAYGSFVSELYAQGRATNKSLEKWFPQGYKYEDAEKMLKKLDFSPTKKSGQKNYYVKEPLREYRWTNELGACLCTPVQTHLGLVFIVRDGLIVSSWADVSFRFF